MTGPNKKILVVRFSSIGDIVLTTPVVRALKQQLNAEVHYLTKNGFRNIVEPNPHIDKVFSIQKKVSEILPELKKEKYDLVVDLHNNLRTRILKLGLGVPIRSFNKINFQKWLIVQFKINRLPKVHIVDRYMDTVKHLGVTKDGAGLDYFIPPREEVNVSSFFQKYAPEQDPQKYIAFVTGAAHATKRLPIDKIISICQKIQLPVVLLGGPDEEATGEQIRNEAGDHVINGCGKLRLHQSASLVRQAHKVITHDTGLMHIAAAFHKEIISIWGNTIPEFGMTPFYGERENRNTTIEVSGLSCRPCSKIGYKNCPKGHFKCMKEISEAKTTSATNS